VVIAVPKLGYAVAMRTALAALALLVAAEAAQAGEELNEGWWIVAGSFRQGGADRNDASIAKASAGLRRCGFRPFNDFSAKFAGFAPGFDVVVTGPYTERAGADAIMERVQRCVPSAYVKNARYLGE
jgi:hypothetical protein